MRLFFSLFEKPSEEEEKEKKKKRCNRRKRVAGALIMLMLFVSIYAQPASAFSFSSWWSGVKERASNVGKMVVSATVGIVVGGACIASTLGFGTPACIAMGVAAAGATYAAMDLAFGGDEGETQTTATFTSERQANETTPISDPDNPDADKITDEANQRAYQAIAELNAKLRSDFVQYGSSSNSGDIIAYIYGPEKIYGFAAFPTQVKLVISESPIKFNRVHIQQIKVYLKDINNTIYWTRTWDYGETGSEGLNGAELVYTTILKAPDDLVYNVRDAINSGQITKELYEKLWNTSTREWEINVDITAYRESWIGYPNATTPEACQQAGGNWSTQDNKCYVFERNIPITVHAESTTAWKHVTGFVDVATIDEGMYGSLPIKFLLSARGKWTIYLSRYAGAVSDFIIVTAATPVHVLNSTADYKFIIAPNPGYFEPATNYTIVDDFRFATLRVIEGGRMELADTVTGTLGGLTEPVEVPLSVKYTDAPGTLTYHSIGLVYAEVVRDDGTRIPIWLAAEPQISVLANIYMVLQDQEVEKLIQYWKDQDPEKVQAEVDAMINGLYDKIEDTKQLLQKAQELQNQKAEGYAKKAIDEYEAAIDNLEKIKQTDDYQEFLNRLNAAKKHEMAGDFYRNAARKALYGDLKQAELDAKKAEEYSDLANQYEPHVDIFGTAKSLLQQKVFGIPLWALLVILFVLVGAIVIWKKLL